MMPWCRWIAGTGLQRWLLVGHGGRPQLRGRGDRRRQGHGRRPGHAGWFDVERDALTGSERGGRGDHSATVVAPRICTRMCTADQEPVATRDVRIGAQEPARDLRGGRGGTREAKGISG